MQIIWPFGHHIVIFSLIMGIKLFLSLLDSKTEELLCTHVSPFASSSLTRNPIKLSGGEWETMNNCSDRSMEVKLPAHFRKLWQTDQPTDGQTGSYGSFTSNKSLSVGIDCTGCPVFLVLSSTHVSCNSWSDEDYWTPRIFPFVNLALRKEVDSWET